MFNKVLIANRGAIAVRICRTLKAMGVTAVAVYSDADKHALHRRVADEAYALGAGTAAETYLNQEKLFAIIAEAGVDAVHPGYGFLSENPEFVRMCESRGATFIGPTAEQMTIFGLKHSAREVAESSGVPLLSGSGLLNSAEEAVVAASAIGYPVILKSTAGGGGIGMQVCADDAELVAAFDSVRRLSSNNFANDGVFVEKYIQRARHIEVQIFGDGEGQAVALGERDCSAQRRNQKVLEETPAPGLSDCVRSALHETALRLMKTVNYRSAGTVEFIYDDDSEQFWFLEVNTRLQVEHGVTEQVYGVDLVQWMVQLAADELTDFPDASRLHPRGCAIQARVYAEDPNKGFQPSAGLLTHVQFPQADGGRLRIDHWIDSGLEVSPFYDPMLAKVIAHRSSRDKAISTLRQALGSSEVEGIETNLDYLQAVLDSEEYVRGEVHTRFLNALSYQPQTVDVMSPGTLTTVQDYPGRCGYWQVGVPPSGPFDSRAFRLGNRLLDNELDAAGLEITLNGPTLRFNCSTQIVLTGAPLKPTTLNDQPIEFNCIVSIRTGDVLTLGKAESGARAYLTVSGGIQCTPYLGSRATFTLGRFGGHGGRALRSGDVIHLQKVKDVANRLPARLPDQLVEAYGNRYVLRVIYGPHGAPDFFTEADIRTFFTTDWQVHYNSSRTGIRLTGPKPEWARTDGGEAGMHPSNIHDNAYAFGTVDFTGDMPVILGPDGPSLGGFVCPATVIYSDLWKLGQLKAGDAVRFEPITLKQANELSRLQDETLSALTPMRDDVTPLALEQLIADSPILHSLPATVNREGVVYRPAGDRFLLVEYGPLTLDIRLRFRVHALMLYLQERQISGILELTPGIRSLQIHYDPHRLSVKQLLDGLVLAEQQLHNLDDLELPSRTVYLPLSWDDEACHLAVNKYMQSVRSDAPWCPNNIEFIRRINGLDSVEDVKRIVFEAHYVVMGLGDVYLGAPVATPLDPRHRLVTTKYNPARTWTAENSVGIGGSYLCVYGMEGPGGYQFVGRTLQMWNRFHRTREFDQPWLLRFFDQIRFYPVDAQELARIREDFPNGNYPLRIEPGTFSLSDYEQHLQQNRTAIEVFTVQRERAFDAELQRWRANGQFHYQQNEILHEQDVAAPILADGAVAVDSHVAGSIWKVLVSEGDCVSEGDVIVVLESMKMEIDVYAPISGVITQIQREEGQSVNAGQRLLVIEATET